MLIICEIVLGTPKSTDVVLRLTKGLYCANEANKFILCLLSEMVEVSTQIMCVYVV